jgi:hypothetical protein
MAMPRYLPITVAAAVVIGIFLMFDWRTAVAITGLLIVVDVIAAVRSAVPWQ